MVAAWAGEDRGPGSRTRGCDAAGALRRSRAPAMAPSSRSGQQHQLAVFIDFENIALGLGNAPFDVRRVLDRLLEKGKVIVKVAYADWHRFRSYTTGLHESGIELIEIPRRSA